MDTELKSKNTSGTYLNTRMSLLFKAKKTSIQMMRVRGYDITQESPFLAEGYPIDFFIKYYSERSAISKKRFREEMAMTYQKDDQKVLILFPDSPANGKDLNIDNLRVIMGLITEYSKHGFNHVIVVAERSLTIQARKKFSKDYPLYRLEYFLYQELSFNPLDNELVPHHQILTEQQKKKLFSGELTPENLSKIYSNDKICRFLGGLEGDVFLILRMDPISANYRRVISV